MKFNTQVLHGKGTTTYADGSTLPPISQAVEYQYDSAEDLDKVFHHRMMGFAYTRVANPTVSALEQRVNELEGGIGAYALASGMAAIAEAILNIAATGDEIIVGSGVYGGTIELFKDLAELGITARYVEPFDAEHIEPLLNDKTRAVFGELIGNPSLAVADIPAIAELVHAHQVPLILDVTTATPFLTKALQLGADILIHSTTKYIAGSGQAIGGIIVDGGKFKWDYDKFKPLARYRKYGQMSYMVRLRTGLGENVGACMAPMNAYLTVLGLQTLGLRMDRICSNAQKLAEALTDLPVSQVRYPGLSTSPDHNLVERDLGGRAGGIITFRAGSRERAFAIINALKCITKATSLGDVRTLVLHPASTIFMNTTTEENALAGVFDDTIRISVGIEDAEDLIEDFRQAIASADKTDEG